MTGRPRVLWLGLVDPRAPTEGRALKTWSAFSSLAGSVDIEFHRFGSPQSNPSAPAEWRCDWHEWDLQASRGDAVAAFCRGEFVLTRELRRAGAVDVLRARSKEAELVVFDDFAFAPFVKESAAPVLLAVHDCLSWMFATHMFAETAPAARIRNAVRAFFAWRYERHYYPLASAVQVISMRDRALLELIVPGARVRVARNLPTTQQSPVTVDASGPVVLWIDLRIAGGARGVLEFLAHWPRSRLDEVVVCSREHPARWLGEIVRRYPEVRLTRKLEELRSVRVLVVPDVGGAGLKNRILAAAAWRVPIAASSSQLWGLHELENSVVHNTPTIAELAEYLASADLTVDERAYDSLAALSGTVEEEWRLLFAALLAVRK